MIRSIEFPVDPRWIKSGLNSPLATIGARMAKAANTRRCIETVTALLSSHFTRPHRFTVTRSSDAPAYVPAEVYSAGWTVPNHWTVKLTRIAPGTLDPLTSGASMKAIQDAIARWCGVPDERDAVWTWVEPIGQEKRGQHVWGVRVELEDLAPGQDIVVKLDLTASAEGRKAASTVKRLATKATKGSFGKHSASGLPSAWRARETPGGIVVTGVAQEANMRRTAKVANTSASKPGPCNCDKSGRHAWGALGCAHEGQPYDPMHVHAFIPASMALTTEETTALPPDLQTMRALARSVECPISTLCGAAADEPCNEVGGESFEYGVHVGRARAAGLPAYPSAAELDAGVRPVCDGGICLDCDLPVRGVIGSRSLQAAEREIARRSNADPGEEKSPRALVPCPRASCFAALDLPCIRRSDAEVFVNGVHWERAKAAGVQVGDAVKLDMTPWTKTNGSRRVVPAAGPSPKAWCVLPWRQCPCESEVEEPGPHVAACPWSDPAYEGDGEGPSILTRDSRLDGEHAPPKVTYRVPAEHAARFGTHVTLTRRASSREGVSVWLYE